ncbi:MAG: PLD nuclease N-terminal domain-containing protein [Pirellulales bacterium]
MDIGIGIICCGGFSGLIGLALTVFWIWTLVDCLMNEPPQGNDKLIWALVIILLWMFGALLYYFIRRPQRIEQYGK